MAEMENASNSLADFVSQWQANTKAISEIAREIQEKFEEPVRPFLEMQKRLEETIKPWVEVREQMAAVVDSWRLMWERLCKDFSHITSQALEFQDNLNSLIGTAFTKFHEEFKKLPQRTQDALMILGTHGWYLDLEMTLPGLWALEKAMANGDSNEAERALVEYFREKRPEIEKDLVKYFPNRGRILSSAFKAHSRGEYELSVPVFLAQADGICQELIGIQLFRKQGNVPAIAKYIETFTKNAFQTALLYPLSVTLPISASKHERSDTFVGLNRHQVLHGESTEYATEINSLKAISLLNYVAHVLKDRKRDYEIQ